MLDHSTNSETKSGRSPLFFAGIIAAGVIAVIVIVALVTGNEPVASTSPAADTVVEQEPTGAGTNPDGVVDEAEEGLLNETTTDDFVDSSAASEPQGIVEPDAVGPEPQSSAEGLEPAVGEGNVDRMLPETDDN